MTFTQIVNLCAAFQFGIFTFVSRSMQRALQYTKRRRIKVSGVYSAGEMSGNEALRLEFERISKKYGVKVVEHKAAYSQAVEAAWMGWELKNACEDVDIRNCKIEAFDKLPLGSYFEDILNDEKSF